MDLGIVILLKGPIDITTNGKRTILNSTGHPGMTVGGTGDVLAGIVDAVNCIRRDWRNIASYSKSRKRINSKLNPKCVYIITLCSNWFLWSICKEETCLCSK